ncbi:MAG TPA: universal stress protein [Chryseosolibacter sp.]|nr:universal stress protein [Chryseosolibacter sp.]
MKRILVPTDLSPAAETGLHMAVEIARKCGALVNLVNFTRHPIGSTFLATGDVMITDEEPDIFGIEVLKATKERMEALVEKYIASGVTVNVAVVDSEYKHGIDEYLRSENIDLIVMGTSGEQNAKEVFTGNHTEQTIKVSACPVLSIRDGFSIDQLKTMVVAVDVLTDNKSADGLTALKELAECFDACIHLVHVRDTKKNPTLILDEYFNQMAAIAGLQKYKVRIIDTDDVVEGLTSYAQEVNAGFLAVIKNSKEGIFRIFSQNLSDKLIKEEGRPVVTVNLQNS